MEIFLKKSIFFMLFFVIIKINSQNKIFGTIYDIETKKPIPICQIKLTNNSFVTSFKGEFKTTTSLKNDTLSITHYNYDPIKLNIDSTYNDKKIEIFLKPNRKIFFECDKSEYVNNIFKWKKFNPTKKTKYSKWEYSKISVSTNDNKRILNEYHKNILPFLPNLKNQLDNNHHLLLMECVISTNNLNKLRVTEKIESAVVSGTDNPSIFGLILLKISNSYLTNNLINIFGNDYYNPFSKKYANHYQYYFGDTLYENDKKYLRYFFNNDKQNTRNKLQGFIIFDFKNNKPKSIYLTPKNTNSERQITVFQDFKYKNEFVFQNNGFVEVVLPNLLFNNHSTTVTVETKNFKIDNEKSNVKKKELINGIVISEKTSKILIDSIKKTYNYLLTENDNNTYKFYDSVGKLNNMSKIINIGYNTFNSHLPIWKFDVLLKRFVSYNDVERFNVGFGIQTNDRFSKKNMLNSYISYGTRDTKFKYGLGYAFFFDQEKDNFLELNLNHNYKEPAGNNFRFVNTKYANEELRKFRVKRFDLVNSLELNSTNKINNYITIGLGIQNEIIMPQYSYIENKTEKNELNLTELNFSTRIAYGEKLIKIYNQTSSLGSDYPIVYLKITKSVSNQYNYTSTSARVDWKKKWIGLGTLTLSSEIGKNIGYLPYQKLTHSRGSFADISFFTQNSFEAMGYNEFLNDQFLHLFTAFQLPTYYKKNGKSLPIIMIVNNYGIGTLSEKYRSNFNIPFKTMENSYFESGIMIKNLIKFNIYGLKLGLGTGIITRFGAYSNGNTLKSNSVLKIGVNAWL